MDRNRAFFHRRIFRQVGSPVNPVFLVITVGAPRRRTGKRVQVVREAHHHAVAQLFEVVDAVGLGGFGLGFGQRRQQQPCENGNDRDDDQQLNQGESRSSDAPGPVPKQDGTNFHRRSQETVV